MADINGDNVRIVEGLSRDNLVGLVKLTMEFLPVVWVQRPEYEALVSRFSALGIRLF